jgi:hypothetical protein
MHSILQPNLLTQQQQQQPWTLQIRQQLHWTVYQLLLLLLLPAALLPYLAAEVLQHMPRLPPLQQATAPIPSLLLKLGMWHARVLLLLLALVRCSALIKRLNMRLQ